MDKEAELIKIQIYLIIISISTFFISLILTYNQYLKLSGRKKLFDDEVSLKIAKFNRILILLNFICFLILSYKLYKYTDNKINAKIEIMTSWLAVISSILSLYATFNSTDDNGIADIENPTF